MENQIEVTEAEQETINEIEVKDAVLCSNAIRVCDPESYFEMIEQCKICGRCV
ncbi:hypothetical protein [Flavobacterium sp. FlaQc-28]|uniref:hypothetical protein n=1 Tax=Flavobacterium sp. FlaQc-28 TaxID=3374178 RepID=UPI0037580A9D